MIFGYTTGFRLERNKDFKYAKGLTQMRRIESRGLLLIVCAYLVICPSPGQEPRAGKTMQGEVSSATAAVSLANEWTGFDSLYDGHVVPSTVCAGRAERYADTITPFLYQRLNGRRSWRVTYHELPLALDSSSRGNAIRDCEVWVDSLTGQLLLVKILQPERPKVGYRMPTAAESEQFLERTASSYAGLPQVRPAIDVLAALKLYGSKVLSAKEVWVQYVMFAKSWPDPPKSGLRRPPAWADTSPKPAWVIYLRGTPPYQFHSNTVLPVHMVSNWRMVFDAMTGTSLDGESNTPYPLIDEATADSSEK